MFSYKTYRTDTHEVEIVYNIYTNLLKKNKIGLLLRGRSKNPRDFLEEGGSILFFLGEGGEEK
jgi:hypothetical protein